LPVKEFTENSYLVMATKNGLVKKTDLMAYSHPRTNGIIALKINDNDELISVRVTNGEQDVFIATRKGKSIRFKESDIRDMGRVAAGNIGIRMDSDDQVVGMDAISE